MPWFMLGVVYAALFFLLKNTLDETARARNILTDLEAFARRRYVDQTHLAAIHAALGDKDKAFAALERASDARSARISALRFYPWLSPLFDDPRFAKLEDKIAHSAIVLPPESTASHD